jgi:hypothetical protein
MKTFLRIAMAFIGLWLLVELNSGTFFTDIKDIFHKNPKEIQDSTYFSDTIPKDYLDLLNLKEGCCPNTSDSTFNFLRTVKSKLRNPISIFVYKKNIIYRFIKWTVPLLLR